jgi:hypothetical protein
VYQFLYSRSGLPNYRLVESAIVNGVKLFLGANVESITKLADDFIVRTVCVETNDFWIAGFQQRPTIYSCGWYFFPRSNRGTGHRA